MTAKGNGIRARPALKPHALDFGRLQPGEYAQQRALAGAVAAGHDIGLPWVDGEPIQVKIPIKVELKVTEAPPNTRGNTAQGGDNRAS